MFTEDDMTTRKIKKSVHYGVTDETDTIKVTADETKLKQIGMDMGKTFYVTQ